MAENTWLNSKERFPLRSRLVHHLRCLQEDATDPELSQLERLALLWDRARRVGEIKVELDRGAFLPLIRDAQKAGISQ